jgi:hypothetical protein
MPAKRLPKSIATRTVMSANRIRQRAHRQPRIGSNDVNRGTAGVLQKLCESGFAGDEHDVAGCRHCAAGS